MSSSPKRMRYLALVAFFALGSALAPAVSGQKVFEADPYDSITTDSQAESYMRSPHPVSECLATMSPASFPRVPIVLNANVSDTATAIRLQADLMAQNVSRRLIALLGGSPDVLPSGDSTVSWLSIPAQLIVTILADGTVTRRGVSERGSTSAVSFLVRAFDAAQENDEVRIIFPDSYAAQSLVVRLELQVGSLGPDGHLKALPSRHSQFGVFTIPYPELIPALPKEGNPNPRYPVSAEMHRVQAFVLLQFVVDTLGKEEPGTFRDIWPADKPRLTGDLGQYYDEFVHAVRAALPRWQFNPAHMGSCPVKQMVQLPIKFMAPGSRP